MAMSTYTEMKDTLVRWLNRENFAALTAEVDVFLDMAQRRIGRDCDLNAMEEVVTLQAATPTVPSDLLRVKGLTIDIAQVNHEVQGTTYRKVKSAGATADLPAYYTILGTEFIFGPPADSDYAIELVYYKLLPLLSDSVESNWLSLNVPELILFAAMAEACVFLKDDQRAALYNARFQEVYNSLKVSEERMALEGGALQAHAH